MIATAMISAICPNARIEVPRTLPASSARVGIAAMRISITRVCFSSTTDWAIVMPNVSADAKNTSPKPSATR
jgi:hypothetical protein